MRVALVLHIYQPPVQEESIVRQVATECYLPLIKLIKNRRNQKFTLNIPLSLLELMDKYGYKEWLSDIRNLYESDRVELTGTGAYHPLLTEIPQQLVEEQISLNEYGLGYYFGSKQGFEGEPSIMIKNIQGFFSPELAVNNTLVGTLSEFGYKWFLAERNALPEGTTGTDCIFSIKGAGIKVVCRDKELSNMISFKRNLEIEEVSSYLESKLGAGVPLIIALDGEFFGHHYKDGIYLLESILDKLESYGITLSTVSGIVDEYEHPEITEIRESSWGASDEEHLAGQIYPYWLSKDNELQVKLWKLQNTMIKAYIEQHSEINTTEFQTLPVWKTESVKSIQEQELQDSIHKYILMHKYLHSDKFWWSSKKEILGKYLYHPGVIKKSLEYVEEIISYFKNEEIKSKIAAQVKEINDLLK